MTSTPNISNQTPPPLDDTTPTVVLTIPIDPSKETTLEVFNGPNLEGSCTSLTQTLEGTGEVTSRQMKDHGDTHRTRITKGGRQRV